MAEKGFDHYSPGVNHVGSYQASGVPWITGSNLGAAMEHRVRLPQVSKSITIINTDTNGSGELKVYFASTSSKDPDGATHPGSQLTAKHYITLPAYKDSITMNVRVKDFYIHSDHLNGSYQVFAELTNIDRARMYTLSGSGINEYTHDIHSVGDLRNEGK